MLDPDKKQRLEKRESRPVKSGFRDSLRSVHENKQEKNMASDMKGPPRWLYFILSVCALMASGIYLCLAMTAGASTGRILRVIIFGLLGILWVLMYGAGGRQRGPEKPPASQQ
jgi:Flp pilus assembly protein TadB